MKTRHRNIILPLAAALALGGNVFGALTLRELPSGRTSTVPTITIDGTLLAAVPMVFERLGFTWKWDDGGQQLTCIRNAQQYVFTKDIPYYFSGDALLPMPSPAARVGATIFLPAEEMVAILKEAGGPKIRWDAASQVLTVSKSSRSIVSVSSEKKQNGVLVTVELSDSLPFDYTYYYPNVTLSFFGATVDTSQVRSVRRVGLVDSIFSVQFKESAQVSLLVTREIEEPQIDYLQDLNTILVSLKPKKSAEEAKKPAAAAGGGICTIVIDPGHGGKDPGAIGPGGTMEKDVTLKIARHLRDLFKKTKGVKVYLTRESDEFVTLADRTRMANAWKADLFVSIHVDAMPVDRENRGRKTTKGYKVYFLSQAKNEDDKLVAMRENAVIGLEEKPQHYNALKNVLVDLAGNEYLRESQDLSILIDRQLETSMGRKIRRLQRGIGQANFWVLNGAYMPSILIECGFISHPSEEQVIAEKSFQKEMANAIYQAVMDFASKYGGRI
ncbi:MAG: N-acetylmuramoyl-L-alanine amidase [Chitinispirillaceae bacterium]|nr:N-acetylmuramoyl-L-alanine amidase [Chitinispirillaceae bacterium]